MEIYVRILDKKIKLQVLTSHKLIYKFKIIPKQIQTGFFSFLESDRLIIRFMWKNIQGQIPGKTLAKKSNTGWESRREQAPWYPT